MWVDYEQEETQAILDAADMVLEKLVSECVAAANQIENERDELRKEINKA